MVKFQRKLAGLVALPLSLAAFSGCNGSSDLASAAEGGNATFTAPKSGGFPVRSFKTDALIFNLDGLSGVDAESIASILQEHGKTYELVSSAELNKMSVDEIAQYGMIVVPGGYGGQASESLDPQTRERVRRAVVERGVNYVGFCAGAFVAVGPTPSAGGTPDYGFSLVPASSTLNYFYPYKDGNDDVAASLPISFADGSKREILFWGGPALPEVSGGVVARYGDGTPAIVQVQSGNAFITISGPHPEGNSDWKHTAGVTDPDGDDFDIAWNLFDSTLRQVALKAF